MSELNRAPFTRKRHRARSVARFCWTLPFINIDETRMIIDNQVSQRDQNAKETTPLICPIQIAGQKRALSTTTASSSMSKNMSSSETSIDSLQLEKYTTKTNKKTPKQSQAKKKIKKSSTEYKNEIDLNVMLQPLEFRLNDPNSTYPLNYLNFKSFLDKTFSNPFVYEVANEYTSKPQEIADMMRHLHNYLTDKNTKRRFTRIIKKIETESNTSEENERK